MSAEYQPDVADRAFGFLCGLVGLFAKPWALTLLWRWYVLPLGAPALGLLGAFGLMLTINLITSGSHRAPLKYESESEYLAWAATPITYPLFAVAFGALARGIFA